MDLNLRSAHLRLRIYAIQRADIQNMTDIMSTIIQSEVQQKRSSKGPLTTSIIWVILSLFSLT